jgi:hypothetical protein
MYLYRAPTESKQEGEARFRLTSMVTFVSMKLLEGKGTAR